MNTKLPQRSFAGGEITPEMFGRVDLTKNQTGVALAQNFIALPHGPMARRPGTMFFNETKNSNAVSRLLPFVFNAEQAMQLELGVGYIRFHSPGGTLLETPGTVVSVVGNTVTQTAHGYSTGNWVFLSAPGGRFFKITVTGVNTYTTQDTAGNNANPSTAYTKAARVYEIASPYDATNLFDLHYAQNADVLTIAHPAVATRELRRIGGANWTLTVASFVATIQPPTAPTAAATVGVSTALTPQHYVLTSLAADKVTESLPTADFTCTNNLNLAGNYNVLTWTSADAANSYFVYKQRGGVYGYIGRTVSKGSGSPANITDIIRQSTFTDPFLTPSMLALVTTAAAHGFATNDVILIADTGVASFDGTWKITVVDATHFTYVTQQWDYAVTEAFVGTARVPANSFIDDNITPDTTQVPPDATVVLNDAPGNYPAAVTHHEQRRWFAGMGNKPQSIAATRPGTDANMASSVPSRDDDALSFRIAAAQQNAIRHLVPLLDLIALTVGAEFRVYADNAPAITPRSLAQKPQSYCGSANVQPVVANSSALFVQAQGAHVMELAFDPTGAGVYRSSDVSLFAPHLVNGYSIVQLAFVRAPDKVVWALRSDGVLLGLTYVPEQQVFAWHHHITDGFIESVSVIPEPGEDATYMIIRRTINGRTVRNVERMMTRVFTTLAAAWYVDSGLSYSGAPVTTLSGLYHLEGRAVQVLADGAVVPGLTVAAGTVTLPAAASRITVGLQYTSDLKTLPLSIDGAPAAGKGTVKNVNKVHVRVANSSLIKAGPSFNQLTDYPARQVSDPYGSPPAVRNGEISLAVEPNWDPDASICLREDQPVPLTVSALVYEVAIGG